MCGHVGVAGCLLTADEALMKRKLLLDYWRGMDSTGMAAVRASKEVLTAKIASHPLDLFDMARFKTALNGIASRAFIGHNRAATRGKVNGHNAHPFTFGPITGAHNGTLSPVSFKDLTTVLGEEFDVDSQAIFRAIEEFGIEEVVPQLVGAWALVWYDERDDTINFIRNKERPLWYGYTADKKRLFWASEWQTIDNATDMAATKYDLYEDPDKGYKYWPFAEDTWYRVPLAALSKGETCIDDCIVKVIKGKAPPVTPKADDPFPRGRNTSTTDSTDTTHSMTTSRGNKMLTLVGNKQDPTAGWISEDKFNQMLAVKGCAFCSADVKYGDVGITIHEREGIILCPDCSTGASDAVRIYTPVAVSNIH